MGRSPCCDKTQVKRGSWSPQEDETLKSYLQKHGTGGNWITLPQRAGLKRCGKSCRLRWLNYLRPDIKHGAFTMEEDDIICTLYGKIGSRWSIIASHLPGRTDNDVKNHWNTKLKKKLMATAATTATTSNKDNKDTKDAANNTAFQSNDPQFLALLTQTPPTIMPFVGDDHHNIAFPEGTSKFGPISKFLHSGSQPQEDSSISESSSFAKNENFVAAWFENGGSPIEGLPLMDVGTANSYEIMTTGIWPQESTNLEALPSSHANLFGLSYY